MKRILLIMLAVVLAIGLAVPAALVAANDWDGSINWTGQGSDSLRCDLLNTSPERTEDGWIHWVITQAKYVTAAELELGGSGSGTYNISKRAGGTIHFFTPYFPLFDAAGNRILEATLFYDGRPGRNPQFVISDYCPGEEDVIEPI